MAHPSHRYHTSAHAKNTTHPSCGIMASLHHHHNLPMSLDSVLMEDSLYLLYHLMDWLPQSKAGGSPMHHRCLSHRSRARADNKHNNLYNTSKCRLTSNTINTISPIRHNKCLLISNTSNHRQYPKQSLLNLLQTF